MALQEQKQGSDQKAASNPHGLSGPAALTDIEQATLRRLLECMFPPGGDGGAGALQIGADAYILKALQGPYASFLPVYRATLSALNKAAGGSFVAAMPQRQETLVAALEAGDAALLDLPAADGLSPFDLIWRHLREGLFSDPAHGGNKDFLGWKLIGFPGAQFGYRAEDQKIGERVRQSPQSFDSLETRAPVSRAPVISASRPAEDQHHADVVIIGGGFTGFFIARDLTAKGLRVTILEAGQMRSGQEHVMDEVSATAFRNLGGGAKFNREVPSWRRTPEGAAIRATMSQGLETALGGNSIAWGGVAMRFYEDDFRIRTSTLEHYGKNALPDGTGLADWPMSYQDLEPFYDMAEDLLGVSGNPGANPYEAPRHRPYAMKALRTSGLGARFAEAASDLGYQPFPLPSAITTARYRGREACTYCSFCSRFGCHVDAKASAQNTVMSETLATGLLDLKANARAIKIVTEKGAASGVRYRLKDGSERVIKARKVVLATYTFENTRLLLVSKDQRHPNGLGNNQDQVGRYYMTRQQPSVFGLFEGEELNRFIGPTAQAQAIADLSGDHFDHKGLGFIRGGRIAAFNQYLPIEASGILPPDVPRFGAKWRDFFVNAYNSTAMLFIDPEILPYETNRLDLDPERTDDLGRPVVRITFDIGENERRMIPWLQDRAEEIALKMGATRTWRRPPITGPISTHDVGGTRMGDDPSSSVTDGFGRVHDTEGLYVAGGSNFVSLPAVNPALTIIALALRTADAIGKDLGDRQATGGQP